MGGPKKFESRYEQFGSHFELKPPKNIPFLFIDLFMPNECSSYASVFSILGGE